MLPFRTAELTLLSASDENLLVSGQQPRGLKILVLQDFVLGNNAFSCSTGSKELVICESHICKVMQRVSFLNKGRSAWLAPLTEDLQAPCMTARAS